MACVYCTLVDCRELRREEEGEDSPYRAMERRLLTTGVCNKVVLFPVPNKYLTLVASLFVRRRSTSQHLSSQAADSKADSIECRRRVWTSYGNGNRYRAYSEYF